MDTSTSDRISNSLSCDLVCQYVDDMSAVLSDRRLAVNQVSLPESVNGDYTYVNSNSNRSFPLETTTAESVEFDIEQHLQPTLASGEYLDELTATTQTDMPSPTNNENYTLNDNIRSTSASGQYADLSTSGKLISFSEQTLSQLPANDIHLTEIPTTSLQVAESAAEGQLDSTLETNTSVLPAQLKLYLKINKNGYIEETTP